jgi:hypothetical protein
MWVGIIVIFPILFENAVKVVFIQNQDMVETLFTNRSYPVCCKYSILGNSVDLAGFEPAASSVRWMSRKGKRGKKASITSTMCQNHHTVLAYLFPNCSRIVPSVWSKERRSEALSKWGFDANDVLEKHRLHFSFSFPWSRNLSWLFHLSIEFLRYYFRVNEIFLCILNGRNICNLQGRKR